MTGYEPQTNGVVDERSETRFGFRPVSMVPIEWARYIKRSLLHSIAQRLTNRWDLHHDVETAGRIPIETAGIEVSGDHARSGYDIVSTPPQVFAYIARFFPAARKRYNYLDIGAGKGRTILLASELGFKACLGVEFATLASDVARKNLARYVSATTARAPCTIINSCATKIDFPPGDLVLFFNNPFSPELWPEMVRRVIPIASEDRAITIALIGSFPNTIRIAADLLLESGVFKKCAEGVTPRFWDSYAPFHYIVLENAKTK